MSVARFAFQACAIDHSAISSFRINNLRHGFGREIADCDKSLNVLRSLTVFSSIDAGWRGADTGVGRQGRPTVRRDVVIIAAPMA
jgi:hypothetical protein